MDGTLLLLHPGPRLRSPGSDVACRECVIPDLLSPCLMSEAHRRLPKAARGALFCLARSIVPAAKRPAPCLVLGAARRRSPAVAAPVAATAAAAVCVSWSRQGPPASAQELPADAPSRCGRRDVAMPQGSPATIRHSARASGKPCSGRHASHDAAPSTARNSSFQKLQGSSRAPFLIETNTATAAARGRPRVASISCLPLLRGSFRSAYVPASHSPTGAHKSGMPTPIRTSEPPKPLSYQSAYKKLTHCDRGTPARVESRRSDATSQTFQRRPRQLGTLDAGELEAWKRARRRGNAVRPLGPALYAVI
jgi:hypothetical protein